MRDNSFYYNRLKNILKDSIIQSEDVIAANKILDRFKWKFVHPYVQGAIVKKVITLEEESRLTDENVKEIFVQDFYNLSSTLSFIDGYFIRSKYIEPFAYNKEYYG